MLHDLGRHLSAAICTTKVTRATPGIKLQVKTNIAPNNNAQKQLRYFSTKNKKTKGSQIAKPNPGQISKVKQTLEEVDILICGYCNKEEDRLAYQSSDQIYWVACDSCGLWVHALCGTGQTSTDAIDFICRNCDQTI